MIGIVDYNFIKVKKGLPNPSLDAMKMAAYVRKEKKESIQLLPNLELIPNYDKVYFFTNERLENLPMEVAIHENIEFFGEHFQNNIPTLADHLQPDISIYHDIIQEKLLDWEITEERALSFLDSSYYRAKRNGVRLPIPPMVSNKKVYVYDEDFLQYDDCWDILKDLLKRNPSSIHMIHPINCRTIKQFLYLREDFDKISRSNKVVLDYFVPLHQLETYFGKYKMKLLGEITKTAEVYIYLGKSYGSYAYYDPFYLKNLYYCLHLLFSYYSRNIPIKVMTYIPTDGSINNYSTIYKIIERWANSKDYDKVLTDCIYSKKEKELFNKFIEKNPIMSQFINRSKNSLIKTRGIWRIE